MITIDGSQGEGGGQILRSALALAGVLGVPVRIERIRARRPKPGLQRQHLAAVQAAAQACAATVDGAALGSGAILFRPGAPCAGERSIDIGSAGSAMLVVQAALPILLAAEGASVLRVRGGTHNPLAPPVEFVQDSLLPVLRRIGIAATLTLERHGFNPAGGGTVRLAVEPWAQRIPLDLIDRGRLLGREAAVLIANLPAHIAEREALAVARGLRWSADEVAVRTVDADGPGNAVIIRQRFAEATAVASAFGELRKPAEQVAQDAVRQARRTAQADAPVCEHLADQLLLPLALGAGGVFRTVRVSEHTRTNAAVIAAFLGPVVDIAEADGSATIRVRGRG